MIDRRKEIVAISIGVARISDWVGGSCKFSPLTPFTLDDISHSLTVTNVDTVRGTQYK